MCASPQVLTSTIWCRGNSSVGDIVPEGATHDVASRKSDLDDRNRSRSLHRAHQQRAMGADGHTYCNNEPWKAMSTPGQRAMGSVGSPIGGSCCREGRPPTRSLSIPSASATTPMPTAGGPLSPLFVVEGTSSYDARRRGNKVNTCPLNTVNFETT